MSAPLLLLRPAEHDGDILIGRRARLRERVAARVRATKLDAQLAAGASPASQAVLTLRAQALGDRRARTMIGQRIRRLLSESRGARTVRRAQVPVRWAQVIAAAAELEQLAHRLLSPGPLAARGIAQARLLLVDGCSALYHGSASEELCAATARALENLEPSFGW